MLTTKMLSAASGPPAYLTPTYVGYTFDRDTGGAGYSVAIKNATLSGGAYSKVQPGDVVVVFLATSYSGDQLLTILSSGWTTVDYAFQDAAGDLTTRAVYKKMVGSVDTAIDYETDSASASVGALVMVFGGINDTVLDGTTTVFSNTGSGAINPAAILVNTNDSIVLCAGATRSNLDITATSSNMTNIAFEGMSNLNDLNMAACFAKVSAGTFDPGVWTSSLTPSNSRAVTMALKPI